MLIECKDLNKSFGSKQALQNVNLNVERGKIVGLLGPNGSGKTTLIKILSGILTASSGEALISGKPVGIETKKIVSY
ncbi:MAG: ATP-binding cassette domain-containing protein, partial [Oscillospiraceae bacterium]|nr:ATP-binding cassette domain-containing protein [Oscillospiraceae bacterium]